MIGAFKRLRMYSRSRFSVARETSSASINCTKRVLDIPPNRVAAKLVDLYRKDETPPETFEHLELLKLSKEHYRAKGEGRPTKKDRRDISDYTENGNDDEIE